MPYELKGAAALQKRMKELPEKMREVAGRKAARKAMAPVRASARVNAKKIDDEQTRADIAKNVYIQQSRRQSKAVGGVVMRVGILGGARSPYGEDQNASAQPGGDTRHWRYWEFGSENTPARPILRPALQNNAQAVFDTLTTALAAEIDKL